jgi:hypothetical protein
MPSNVDLSVDAPGAEPRETAATNGFWRKMMHPTGTPIGDITGSPGHALSKTLAECDQGGHVAIYGYSDNNFGLYGASNTSDGVYGTSISGIGVHAISQSYEAVHASALALVRKYSTTSDPAT